MFLKRTCLESVEGEKVIRLGLPVLVLLTCLFFSVPAQARSLSVDPNEIILNNVPSCYGTINYSGQDYDIILIGSQCWFAENLNVGTRINSSSNQTDNGIIEKYCYDNSDANCIAMGGLYQWDEAMQYINTEGAQGLCPAGWHIPTDAEQHILDDALNPETCSDTRKGWGCDPAGTVLKSGGTSGFNALLAGHSAASGSYGNIGLNAFFWSSSQSGFDVWIRLLGSNNSDVYRTTYVKDFGLGFAIRCLKD